MEYIGERALEGMSKLIEIGGVYGKATPDHKEEEEKAHTKDEL